MLEESFLKTNFMGRDGFRWWVGQIPPEGKDYDLQQNGGGWGNRIKVRILGYHPYSVVELPNKDLPWATILMGTTDGSGAQNRATSVSIAPGDTVFGFFLDGDNGQVPVIMGVFGRTSQVPTNEFQAPFVPFTGNTEKVKNDGGIVANSQSNEQSSLSQVSPIATDKKTADRVGEATGQNNDTKTALKSASPAIGQKVLAGSTDSASAVRTIKTEIGNFVSKVQSITDNVKDAVGNARQSVMREIESMTASIQKSAMKVVGDMTKNLSEAMMPALNGGLQALYDRVFAAVFAATQNSALAEKAGTIAQATFIGPVKEMSDAIPCIANSIINGLGDIIKGVLTNVAENVFNFVECIGNQVVGALMNHIIGGVTSFLKPFMDALSVISGGFDIGGFLGGTAEALLGLADKLGCNEVAPEFDLASEEWVIGKGSSDKTGVPVDEILAVANEAKALAEAPLQAIQDIAGDVGSLGLFDFANPSVSLPGFESVLGNCYAGPPELGGCGGTKIKIFGGGKGKGGIANAILQIAEGGRGLTGSLIGVDLVNGGGGYTFPPFVEIVDECGKGFGATARAVIDYDPNSDTYQQITDIYLVTEGQDYTPSTDIEDYILDDENGPNIIDGGGGYDSDNDTVTDNYDNEYSINTDTNGSITKLIRINNNEIPSIIDAMEFTINSATGSGAIIRPRLRTRPVEPQGEVKQVIDCISKDDDLVGYVNGEPYYGPFHTHPKTGRKMVGATHTTTPHQYIYDTQAESLGSSSSPVSTTTQITRSTTTTTTTTNTSTPAPAPTPTPTPPPTTPQPSSSPPPSSPPPSPPPSSGGGY